MEDKMTLFAESLLKDRHQTFIVPGRPNTNHRGRAQAIITAERRKKTAKSGREYTCLSEMDIVAKITEHKAPEYEAYLNLVAQCAKKAGIEKYSRPRIVIEIHVPMLITKYKTKQNVVTPRKDHSDVDNMKAIMDGLRGIAYEDDNVVCDERPLILNDIPEPDGHWFTRVIIAETDWREYIAPEARAWCTENNVLISEEA
jgi:Holliday junction resolvase RusA-like endonuclease